MVVAFKGCQLVCPSAKAQGDRFLALDFRLVWSPGLFATSLERNVMIVETPTAPPNPEKFKVTQKWLKSETKKLPVPVLKGKNVAKV